jgi:hypothetical protein
MKKHVEKKMRANGAQGTSLLSRLPFTLLIWVGTVPSLPRDEMVKVALLVLAGQCCMILLASIFAPGKLCQVSRTN